MKKREIKFKAWNRIVNRVQLFSLEDIETQKGNIQWHNLDLFQFTGLKDEKGVDIYEGDIVRLEIAYNNPDEYKNPNHVYNHETKYVNILISFIDGCFVLDSDYISDDEKMLCFWDGINVIGNISESKELL